MAEGTVRTGPGWLQTLGPATTTVLLRHGETPLSGERRFAGRGDTPLTGTGLKQAAAAAARLAARGGLPGTPMKIRLRHAMLGPPAALRRIQLDVACLCEIDWYAGGIGVVRSVNDTAHLSLPGMT